MADEAFRRKLTAVLSADAVGYSRLMAEDEAATVKTIASYREIMSSLIKQHRGRVVDSPGDNILAEFSSVVDAVQCAVAVQNVVVFNQFNMAGGHPQLQTVKEWLEERHFLEEIIKIFTGETMLDDK